jgi:hypothetical protein
MKPSDRIKEIRAALPQPFDDMSPVPIVAQHCIAIERYLDEQHERSEPSAERSASYPSCLKDSLELLDEKVSYASYPSWLKDSLELLDEKERQQLQRASHQIYGSMGRDARATHKLRQVADELAHWRDDYNQRIANMMPASSSNPCNDEFKNVYRDFVAGIVLLLDIIKT